MANKIIRSPSFDAELKKLAKKYPSLPQKVEELIIQLRQSPFIGNVIPASGGVRKIRIADESKGKGKSGGFRVLSYAISDEKLKEIKVSNTLEKEIEKEKPEYLITLLSIYDKSEYADIAGSSLKKFVNLLFPKKTKRDNKKEE
jgi:mRNA-degrading endonuclease RelE of RelBE toxin-antitoxin system